MRAYDLEVTGSLKVQGDIKAKNYIIENTTSHITTSFSSGSTIFGDTFDDTHQFTGSIFISGSATSLTATANVDIGGNISGSSISTGSFSYAEADKFRFIGDSDTGLSRIGANWLGLTMGGANYLSFNTANASFRAIVNPAYNATYDLGIATTNQWRNIYFSGTISGSVASTGSFGHGYIDQELGIGTVIPDVWGYNSRALTIAGGSSANQYVAFNLGNYSTSTTGIIADINFTQFAADGTTGAERAIIRGLNDGAVDSVALKFYTTATGASVSEKMVIKGDGKVGIGTSDPGSTLDIVNSGNAELELTRTGAVSMFMQAQSAVGVIGTSTNHPLRIITNSGGAIYVETGGDVGIGNPLPPKKLSVTGDISASGDFIGQSTSTGSFGHGHIANNLGIGTTSPVRMLDIVGAGAAIKVDSSDHAYIELDRGAAGNLSQVRYLTAGSPKWYAGLTDSDVSGFDGTEFFIGEGSGGSSDAHFVIDASGNVGIGTASPAFELALPSTKVIGFEIGANAASRAWGFRTDQQAFGDFSIMTSDARDNTLDVYALNINPSGNINIIGNISGSSTSTGSFGSLVVADKVQGNLDLESTSQLRFTGNVTTPTITAASNTFLITAYSGITNKVSVDASQFKFESHQAGVKTIIYGGGGILTEGDVSVPATNKLRLDGTSGHSYIYEHSNDDVRVYVGGTAVWDFLTTGAGVAATGKLHLDGGGNTHLRESSADNIKVSAGGVDILDITTTSISGSATSTGSFGQVEKCWKNFTYGY